MQIERLDPTRLDDLRSLWSALYAHHAVGDPLSGLAGLNSDEHSWRVRRAQYSTWLAEPGGFGFVATNGTPVGYAVGRTRRADGSWNLGATIGSLETLVVAAEHRGRGIGTALLAAARRRFAELGAGRYEIAVVTTNASARRFYERAGGCSFLEILVAPSEPPREA